VPEDLTPEEVQELARVLSDEALARQVLDTAGIGRDRQPVWAVSSGVFWHTLALQLKAGVVVDGRRRVLTAALSHYPANRVLQAALDASGETTARFSPRIAPQGPPPDGARFLPAGKRKPPPPPPRAARETRHGGQAPSLPDPWLSRAVLIGVKDYKDFGLPALPAATGNINDLATSLADPVLWGLDAEHCTRLHDPAAPADVADALERSSLAAQDTFIVYFSGHGLIGGGELFLATRNTSPARFRYTGLPYEWIREIVRSCPARRRIVILDCCFSNHSSHATAGSPSAILGQITIEGAYILAAAPEISVSTGRTTAHHGAFTGGLLEVMQTGLANGSPFLTLDDVYSHTLQTMASGDLPWPTKLGTSTVGDLPLMRNPWPRGLRKIFQRRRDTSASPSSSPSRAKVIAEGVHTGVDAVRTMLGHGRPDSLAALERAAASADGLQREGVGLVREAMETMRRDYGDGAVTAAVVVGDLIRGIQASAAAGVSIDDIAAGIQQAAALARDQLASLVQPDASVEDVSRAVSTALGASEAAETIISAARQVGASNVEVAVDEDSQPTLSFIGRLVLRTAILSPNSTTRPLTLNEPYVLAAPDGNVTAADLLRIAQKDPGPLLLITSKVTIIGIRSLLHGFGGTVVAVRPAGDEFDWDSLLARIGYQLTDKQCFGRATRALVTATSTTVIGLAGDEQDQQSGRIVVRVGGVDRDRSTSARALAIARVVARSGAVAGGGTALYRVSCELPPEAGPLKAALAAPLRQLVINAGKNPDDVCALLDSTDDGHSGFEFTDGRVEDLRAAGILDSFAAVKGTIDHAVAISARYLAAF